MSLTQQLSNHFAGITHREWWRDRDNMASIVCLVGLFFVFVRRRASWEHRLRAIQMRHHRRWPLVWIHISLAFVSLCVVFYHTAIKPLTEAQRHLHANVSLYYFLPTVPLMFHGALQLTDEKFPSYFIVPPLLATMYLHYRVFELWRTCPEAALDVALVHWGPVWQRVVADLAIFGEGVTHGEFGHLVRNFWLAALFEMTNLMLFTRFMGRMVDGCKVAYDRLF